jgi:predicted DNA-binding transcriptional regulator AlpA
MLQTAISGPQAASSSVSPLGVIDIKGVCDLLHTSRTWVEQAIRHDPAFPRPFKLGARRYVKFDDLKTWVEQLARAA